MASTINKLFRWRPVTAWGIAGIMIAVACALETDLPIDWLNLGIVALIILLVQGIIAHAVNDLADEEVDRIAPIDETGRSKLLVSGEMTRSCMGKIISSACVLTILLIILLTVRAGIPVLLFAAFAAYSVFGYSCKPLKLGWHPLSELTVVVPTITMLIMGVMYVMVSRVTLITLFVGLSYGFFNASWFMYSRAQDYEADKAMGKRTTIVLLGLDSTRDCALKYLFVGFAYSVLASACMSTVPGCLIIVAYAITALFYFTEIMRESLLTPDVCSELRLRGMMITVTYGVFASLTIIMEGLI